MANAIEHLIASVDRNGDGEIGQGELSEIIAQIGGESLDEADEIRLGVKSALDHLDGNQDQTVKASEFRNFLTSKLDYLKNVKEVAAWGRHALQLPEAMVAILEEQHISGYDFAELIDRDGAQLKEMLQESKEAIPPRLQRKLVRFMTMALLGVGSPPPIPSTVQTKSLDCQTLQISWSMDDTLEASSISHSPTDQFPVHKYRLFRRGGNGADDRLWNVLVDDSETQFVDNSRFLEPGKRYFYRLQAWNAVGRSPTLEITHAHTCGGKNDVKREWLLNPSRGLFGSSRSFWLLESTYSHGMSAAALLATIAAVFLASKALIRQPQTSLSISKASSSRGTFNDMDGFAPSAGEEEEEADRHEQLKKVEDKESMSSNFDGPSVPASGMIVQSMNGADLSIEKNHSDSLSADFSNNAYNEFTGSCDQGGGGSSSKNDSFEVNDYGAFDASPDFVSYDNGEMNDAVDEGISSRLTSSSSSLVSATFTSDSVDAESGRAAWLIEASELETGEKLGEGHYGVVYKACYNGTDVVKKVLKDVYRGSLKNFEEEVKILKDLRHPNTILFIGACYGDRNSASLSPFNSDMEYARQQRFIVTEFLAGGSLWDLINSPGFVASGTGGDFPTAKCFRICADVCCGMAYLHSRLPSPVVHGDLTSSNILLHESGVAKVADFGIARYKSGRADNGEDGEEELPPQNIWYAAPEVLQQRRYQRQRLELRQRQKSMSAMRDKDVARTRSGEFQREVYDITPAADMYSFAIILVEIFSVGEAIRDLRSKFERDVPRFVERIVGSHSSSVSQSSLLNEFDVLRPQVPDALPRELTDDLQQMWHPNPTQRPLFVSQMNTFTSLLAKIDSKTKSMLALSRVRNAFGKWEGQSSSLSGSDVNPFQPGLPPRTFPKLMESKSMSPATLHRNASTEQKQKSPLIRSAIKRPSVLRRSRSLDM